jgi:hypothetical protein
MLNRVLTSVAVMLFATTGACFAGQSPTQAYIEIHKKELAANSYSDLLPIRSKASIAKDPPMTDEEKAQIFPLFKATLPKTVTVTGETIEGNKATVTATAAPDMDLKPGDKETTLGTITLVLEDGEWKMEKESWNSKAEMH